MTKRQGGSAARFWRQVAWAVGLAVAISAGLAATGPGREWLHKVDSDWLGERVMDTLARFRSSEDWSSVEPLEPGQDYTWLKAGDPPLRIAHALGGSGSADANSLAAMRLAYSAGIRLFEVDLSLEASDELRCAHDPGTPRLANACTFESLMAALPEDAWLVLDIKSDFRAAGEHVVRALAGGKARQVIFQLYRPEDVAVFASWQGQLGLPGPIVTAYLAHRSVNTVAQEVARAGVRAFTLPMWRLAAFSERPDGLAVFVHPVHDCRTWREARDAHVYGVYARTDTRCDHG